MVFSRISSRFYLNNWEKLFIDNQLPLFNGLMKDQNESIILCCSDCKNINTCSCGKIYSLQDVANFFFTVRKKKYKLSNSEILYWLQDYFSYIKEITKEAKCVSCLINKSYCMECGENINWKDNLQVYNWVKNTYHSFINKMLRERFLSTISQKKRCKCLENSSTA